MHPGRLKHISLYIMALLYIGIGTNHFINPDKFQKIIPPFIPFPLACVYFSGLFEIIFGAGLLFKKYRRFAAIGLIILLIIVFPANLYMLTSGKFQQFPQWLLWLRLPLQLLLIAWAWVFVKKK